MFSFSYGSITCIRCKGYNLRLAKRPTTPSRFYDLMAKLYRFCHNTKETSEV